MTFSFQDILAAVSFVTANIKPMGGTNLPTLVHSHAAAKEC